MSHNIKHVVVPIPDIPREGKDVHPVLLALKENVELMTRQRGTIGSWMPTFVDLVELGLVTEEKVNELLAKRN